MCNQKMVRCIMGLESWVWILIMPLALDFEQVTSLPFDLVSVSVEWGILEIPHRDVVNVKWHNTNEVLSIVSDMLSVQYTLTKLFLFIN